MKIKNAKLNATNELIVELKKDKKSTIGNAKIKSEIGVQKIDILAFEAI